MTATTHTLGLVLGVAAVVLFSVAIGVEFGAVGWAKSAVVLFGLSALLVDFERL